MTLIEKLTYTISFIIISAVCFLLPTFFLTVTTDFYDFNKFALLFVGIIILMVMGVVHLVTKHEITVTSSSITIPALLFLASAIATLIFNSPNKIESLLSAQGAGGIIVVTLWFLLLVGIIKLKDIPVVIHTFIASGTILGLLAILQILNIGVNRFVDANSPFASQYWTPAGSLLSLVLFLIALFPIVLIQFERKIREFTKSDRQGVPKSLVVYTICTIIILISILVILSRLLFIAQPVLLPFAASWTITLESLKNVQRAVLGVGSGNYIFAFTTGKPGFMNVTDFWNVRFLTASNWFMQIITELGLIGLGTYILLILGLLKKLFTYVVGLRKKIYRYNSLFLGVTIAIFVIILQQLILPSNFLQQFTFYTLLALASIYMTEKTHVENSKILSYILTAFAVVFIGLSSYVMYRAYSAETLMKASVDASARNNAEQTYQLQAQAIQANPYVDRYRVIFSQTNLALATALSQKQDLSDSEKIDVITLLTQTTNEGKAAIFANPTNVQNWENLARVYKTMVNQVRDADRWSIESYQQAIALDPLNPLLRLELGGVFYSVSRFDVATRLFQESVNLKPDWANAYYNLALALREQKDFANSSLAMQRAIDLLPADAGDRERAQKELDDIKKNIPPTPPAASGEGGAAQPAQGSQLNPPPSPAATSQPNLTLPDEAAPPQSSLLEQQGVTPSQTPQPQGP